MRPRVASHPVPAEMPQFSLRTPQESNSLEPSRRVPQSEVGPPLQTAPGKPLLPPAKEQGRGEG